MTKRESDIVQSLLLGGVIGAALGALVSKNKGGAALGAIAGAALFGSDKAYKNAQETEIPLVIEEEDALYRVYADGTKKLIKRIPKSSKNIPQKFILK